MRNKKLLYIPLILLFIFAMSVLAVHYYRIFDVQAQSSREVGLPFNYSNGRVTSITPQAESAGIRVGDTIREMNGRDLGTNDDVFVSEMANLRVDDRLRLVMMRKTADGKADTYETEISALRIERNFEFYSKYIVLFLFTYLFPTVCILLGFYVLFVRPFDPLAWILLFVMLGLSSLGLEMYWEYTLAGAFQKVFFSTWAPAMLLFGIYFPERLTLDQKLPWLKWFLILPLGFQVFIVLAGLLRGFSIVDIFPYIVPLTTAYSYVAFPVNMVAIGLFFATLGYKSATMTNPDSRRRLRLMVYGTSISMLPSFLIVLYRFFSGARGSTFEIVPFWIAIISLFLMLLFPLTMAYVIVVHRAMDVGVVIRQGVQYALAKNGVRVLQILLLAGVILGFVFIVRNFGEDISLQIAFVVGGIAMIPLIDFAAKRLKIWIDKKFFREAYDAEKILIELSDDVRTMVETKPLLETVAAKISESLHVPQVALLLKNNSNFVPAYALGFDTPPVVSLADNSRAIQKLRSDRHIVLYDDMTEITSIPTVSLDEREQLRELNSQILLPVAVKNELSGIISLSPKRSEEPYTASDLRLLRSLAGQTGLALENSRLAEAFAKEAAQRERLNAEVEIAREVQERLFPQELPSISGLDYYGACRPALGVGGDYYDFLELPDGKFGIAIGDVSGKGIGASLMMASLQASLRGQALHAGDDLASLMSHVNKLIYETSTSNRYATFFYAQYDPQSHMLAYVNAGHNPPFLLRHSGVDSTVEKLEVGGPVVGMLPSMLAQYEQGEIKLEPGDLLVGFTDGISEAMNHQEEEWSEEAMLEELMKLRTQPAEQILLSIVAAADHFADGAKQHDDMTMVVVRLVGE